MDRRESFKMIALAPLMAGFTWTGRDVERAREQTVAARAAGDFEPQFFTAHEYETVRILVDLILPADERSGSATELGVPEFMDFMMTDRPDMQTPMRGGLAWLDAHTHRRFGRTFAEATEDERKQILDEIAYPEEAAPEVAHGVAFFNRFRNLTASGFWTTKEGMEDLQYMGNRFVTKWEGAPEAEVKRLGLSFPDWDFE